MIVLQNLITYINKHDELFIYLIIFMSNTKQSNYFYSDDINFERTIESEQSHAVIKKKLKKIN